MLVLRQSSYETWHFPIRSEPRLLERARPHRRRRGRDGAVAVGIHACVAAKLVLPAELLKLPLPSYVQPISGWAMLVDFSALPCENLRLTLKNKWVAAARTSSADILQAANNKEDGTEARFDISSGS